MTRLSGLLTILLLAGCSATVVQQTSDLSQTGIGYSHAMAKVNDMTLERSLMFSAEMLATELPRTEEEFSSNVVLMRKRVDLVRSHALFLTQLSQYFTNLAALASGDQSEATAKSVGELATALKKPPAGLELTDDQVKALTGLAGMINKQIHASEVTKALERDADDVARALRATDRMLDLQIDIIQLRVNALRERTLNVAVKTPFIQGQPLSSQWKVLWVEQLRTPPTIAVLDEAKRVSQDMQEAWRDILRGNPISTDLRSSLLALTAAVEALNALRVSN